jgi:heme/copper-type cytochrome/quinol oxidase subunit 3
MMCFIISDALTFSGFSSLWFSRFYRDVALGWWSVYSLRLHGSFCANVLYGVNDFILIFSSVTMVLAVDDSSNEKE